MQEKEKKSEPVDRLDDFSLDDLPDFEQKEEAGPKAEEGLNLDEYGIWVKGEPEDFVSEDSTKGEAFLEDLALEEGEEPEGNALLEEPSNIDLPEEEELKDLQEAEVLEAAEKVPESKAMDTRDTKNEMTSTDSSFGDFEEISLNDLGIEISDELPEEVEKKANAKKAQATPPPKQEEEVEAHSSDDFQELSLKLEDEEEKPIKEEETAELFLGEERAEPAGRGEREPDFSAFDTLEEVPEISAGEEEVLTLDEGLQETQELKEDLEAKGEEKEEIEVSLSEEAPLEPSEPEIADLSEEKTKTPAETSLLIKIEEELKSIKAELNALKSELGQLRSKKEAVLAKKEEAAEEPADFFEESEEDETIALTGDELDNILTTAEIKETEVEEEAKEPLAEAQEEPLELGEEVISYEEEPALEEAPTEVVLTADEGLAELELEETTAAEAEEGKKEEETIEIEIPEFEAAEGVKGREEVPSIDIEPMAEASPEELDLSLPEETTPSEGEITELALEPEPTAETPQSEEELAELEEAEVPELEVEPLATPPPDKAKKTVAEIPSDLREEIKSVLGYMDQLLEALPEEKIEEFAKSEYFVIYKKLFEELGLVS